MNKFLLLSTLVIGLPVVLWIWVIRLKRRVRQLETFRREFVENVSHEFRTPLSVITGCTETLLEKPVERETARSFLKQIDVHAKKLIRLVEDLLKLSRLENVGPDLSPSLIYLPDFFESLHRRFQPSLEAKEILWAVDLIPPLQHMEADPAILELVFNNLVDNAVKYSDRPGKIRIEGKRKGVFVQFSVEDKGIGIVSEAQDRIFERFYRGHRNREGDEGTGLGLSIVKHSVQSLRGEIQVESEVGQGTRFTFTVKTN